MTKPFSPFFLSPTTSGASIFNLPVPSSTSGTSVSSSKLKQPTSVVSSRIKEDRILLARVLSTGPVANYLLVHATTNHILVHATEDHSLVHATTNHILVHATEDHSLVHATTNHILLHATEDNKCRTRLYRSSPKCTVKRQVARQCLHSLQQQKIYAKWQIIVASQVE